MPLPMFTGESRSDRALWQFSLILSEIAEQASRSKNDGGVSIEIQIRQRTSNEQAFPLTEDVGDG